MTSTAADPGSTIFESPPALLWLVCGICLIEACWFAIVSRQRPNAGALHGHLLVWGFLLAGGALAGLVFPAVVALLGVLVPVLMLFRPTQVIARRGRLYLLHATLSLNFILAAGAAPLRGTATFLGQQWRAFPPDVVFDQLFALGPRSAAWFDLVVGACGILAAVLGGAWNATRFWRQARQVENLPTAKARSAAVGLAELRGVARRIPGVRGDVTEEGQWPSWSVNLAEKILFVGEARAGPRPATGDGLPLGKVLARKKKYAPFYLEDETGRIRVDPRGAELWDGSPSLLFESFRRIHLERRTLPQEELNVTASELVDGDPVYVLGSVEIDPQAPFGAADSERLVVRPREKPTSLLDRVLLLEDATPGADWQHLFLLSSGTEASLSVVLRRAFRSTIFLALLWLGASAWLLSARWDQALAGGGSFLAPRFALQRAERDFEALSRQAWGVYNGKASAAEVMPRILEALERGEDRALPHLHLVLRSSAERPSAGIAAAIRVLGSPDTEAQVTACNVLGLYGASAIPAVPLLLPLVGHPHRQVRHGATMVLGEIGAADPRVPGALARALGDAFSDVRAAAARGLLKLGSGARPAADALRRSLDDPDPRVRDLARRALESVGPDP